MVAVPTARGDEIDASELGFTQPTEMIFTVTSTDIDVNWPDVSFGARSLEERIDDAVRKMTYAKSRGVDTIVDRALPGTGRNVGRIKMVAERVPLNIIVCTGWYTWSELPFYWSFRQKYSDMIKTDFLSLEDLIVRDVEEGIGTTGVRAGLIKCVTDHPGMTPDVEYCVRAGARAHRRTGTPITTHTGMHIGIGSALLQQKVFDDEGVDPTRVNYGHIDFTPPDVPLSEFQQLLDAGSFISFDTMAPGDLMEFDHDALRLERVVALCAMGYADRIMLSNDNSCWNDLLPEGSTPSGDRYPTYCGVIDHFLPALRDAGVTEDQIEQMTIHNPRRFFETRGRGAY